MKNLHEKQIKILELLKENKDYPLTIKQLREETNIESPGVLYHHLNQLEKKGYLKRNPNNSKDYVVLDKPESSIVYIPKYGMAQCGAEGLILDDNIEDQIPIGSSLLRFSLTEAFIVEAKGDSMEPKINSGDIIIAQKKPTAEHGDIIVCAYKSVAMIKLFSKIKDVITLQSFNYLKHSPITVNSNEDLIIAGVVRNILTY